MKQRNGFTVFELIVVPILVLGLVCLVGWVLNIYKACKCDFEAPYRSEAIRVVGIFVPPVGVITGYMELKDGPVDIVD